MSIEGSKKRQNQRLFSAAGGAAGALTCNGVVAATDTIVSVNNLTDKADLTSEFSVSADNEIDNTGGTDTTGDDLLVAVERAEA